jgi:hypothetical protein
VTKFALFLLQPELLDGRFDVGSGHEDRTETMKETTRSPEGPFGVAFGATTLGSS